MANSLCVEISTVYCENYTECKYLILCVQNVESVNVKPGGTGVQLGMFHQV